MFLNLLKIISFADRLIAIDKKVTFFKIEFYKSVSKLSRKNFQLKIFVTCCLN